MPMASCGLRASKGRRPLESSILAKKERMSGSSSTTSTDKETEELAISLSCFQHTFRKESRLNFLHLSCTKKNRRKAYLSSLTADNVLVALVSLLSGTRVLNSRQASKKAAC